MMPNGMGLLGGSSATQSALIVPWPNTECQKYLVFAVQEMGFQKQQTLSYSVVDMSLNGGLGDVVLATKNTILQRAVSEKLTAVKGSGNDLWVMTRGYDQTTSVVNRQFYAYHVDGTGPNGFNITTPLVTSTAGSTYPGAPYTASAGQMKFSPNGKLIAYAVNTAFVEILDFNSTTGAVTQGPPRTFNASSPPFQHYSTYGLEFSPDSNLLYVSTLVAPSQLFQLNINSSTWTNLATGQPPPGELYDIAQLQLGPDNKIYVARNAQTRISVINFPDVPGTNCQFQANGATLATGSNCRLGLPTIIAGDFSCAGTPTPPCCREVTLGISTPKPKYDFCPPTGYSITPTLTVNGLGNIIQVTADILSASVSYSPTSCGTGGAVAGTFASPTSENGFSTTLTAPNGNELVWTAINPSGVTFPSAGLTFNQIKIVLPPPPLSIACKYTLSFCIKYSFTDSHCRTCSIIKCSSFELTGTPPPNPSPC